ELGLGLLGAALEAGLLGFERLERTGSGGDGQLLRDQIVAGEARPHLFDVAGGGDVLHVLQEQDLHDGYLQLQESRPASTTGSQIGGIIAWGSAATGGGRAEDVEI